MEKSSSRSLPMHTEIINIESDSDKDIDFYLNDVHDGPFNEDLTAQSENNLERFMEQNHSMYAHIPQNHCNGFSSHASTSTSGECINDAARENGRWGTSHLSSLGAIHTSQLNDSTRLIPRETYRVSASYGGYGAGHESNEEAIQDPERQMINHMRFRELLESGFESDGHKLDASISQNSKRILPPSLKPRSSGIISSLDEKTVFSPRKNSEQAENLRWSQVGPNGNTFTNGRLDNRLNRFAQKKTHLTHTQPKNALNDHFDELGNGQITELHKTAHGSGKSKLPTSTFSVDDTDEMSNQNQICEGERRSLPSHWIDKADNSSQMTALMHNRVTGQHSSTVLKPSNHLLASKLDGGHMFSDLPIRNDKSITSLTGLYKGRDDFLHENASTTRTLPQYPGKFCGNPRLTVSDSGHLSGSGENRHEHDETPIYQEALQNLGQPKLEDDLPEGILTVSLLKHQKIALAWMVQKEKSVHCAGGILADDQGLGKTISMIALILKQKSLQSKFMSDSTPLASHEALNLDDDEGNNEFNVRGIGNNELQRKSMASASENRRPAAGTLVVCPASVLRQWARELEEKVSSSAELSVVVHHGGTRSKDPRDLAKYDIVLTTYSIVSNEVTKQTLVDDEDESEQKNMEKYGLSSEFASSKKRKQTSNAGKKGKKKGKAHRDSDNDCCNGALGRVRWFRVILDEAQTIKNHRTQVARACSGLRAKRRWCLSGTPMQNSIDDLYSYFRFLKYEPYAIYSSFCNAIKYPISRNASQGYKKLQTVLRIVLLRRTKETKINGEPIIKLPSKSINLESVKFSPEERAFYLNLEADSRQQFKAYAAAGTVKQNYANILLMLLRLRQACDHPILVKGHYSEAPQRDSLEMAKKLPKEMLLNLLYQLEGSLSICPVCSDTPEDPVVTMCAHVFCYQCVSDRLTGDDNCCLALGCKETLGTDLVFSQSTLKASIYDDSNNDATSSSSAHEESSIARSGYLSSKIKAAVDILTSLPSTHQIQESEDNLNSNKPVKTIVFSQWTGMLDLVELSLNHALIQYRRFDGTMSLNARDKAVREFNTDPEVAVMLMSLKAGNLGLNMAAACHVILLDLWWNPTTEDQAIDRAHRIGQTRPVLVSRLTVKDTVEDRILALQDSKISV